MGLGNWCWKRSRKTSKQFRGHPNPMCGPRCRGKANWRQKCQPLVSKAQRRCLRHGEHRNPQVLSILLNSKMWELNVTKEYIFTPLLLSYYDLPSPIRPCLLYCANLFQRFYFSTNTIDHALDSTWLSIYVLTRTHQEVTLTT